VLDDFPRNLNCETPTPLPSVSAPCTAQRAQASPLPPQGGPPCRLRPRRSALWQSGQLTAGVGAQSRGSQHPVRSALPVKCRAVCPAAWSALPGRLLTPAGKLNSRRGCLTAGVGAVWSPLASDVGMVDRDGTSQRSLPLLACLLTMVSRASGIGFIWGN